MIKYNQSARTIKLSNGSVDYVLYINNDNIVETAYFGKSFKCENYNALRNYNTVFVDTYFVDGEEKYYEHGFNFQASRLELGSHARIDKRCSPVIIRRGNGSYETDFRYVSHASYKGIKPLNGLPCAHGENCETVEILFKDYTSELYATLFVTLFSDKDIIVKNFVIRNGGERVELLCAKSMQLDLPSMDYDWVHFGGRWSEERQLKRSLLHDGAQQVSSNRGVSSHYENPFTYLQAKDATADYGEVIGFNLIYSGNFKFDCECGVWQGTHITYGINEEDFCWTLNNGESFTTPQAVISYSYAGTDKMSQNFHSFIKDNLISYRHDREYKPVLFNSWEGCYFDFGTDSIISYIDDAAKIGSELFVLDDGWFGVRNDDRTSLGDWKVNGKKLDLHKVVEHCRKKGLKFGIWFEPEMVSPVSELYSRHSDYALKGENKTEHTAHRHQYVLDFTNPAVVDDIYCQMRTFIVEYKPDYVKWDYNRMVYEHVSPRLGSRQGEVYHRLILGYYSLIGRLTAEFPDLMIEGCAGGGARFDMGTLYYAPQIWTSDESNPARRLFINYYTSLGYPLSTMGTHVNDSTITDYENKANFALFGTYGYEMNPNKLTEEQCTQLKKVADIYKQYHNAVVNNGTLYHLLSPEDGNAVCLQCVSQDKTQSLVLFATIASEREKYRFLRLKGLNPEYNYRVEGEGIYTGEYLSTVGINMCSQWFNEHTFRLLIITRE